MKRLLIGLLATVTLTACGEAVTEPPASRSPTQTVVTGSTLTARPAPAVPTRLRLAAIDAPVVPLELTGTALIPPPDPLVLGWWGRKAGAAHGVMLLVGHTVHTGGGELDNLEDVPVGAVARVSGVRYQVTSVRVINKAALTERSSRLFAQSGPHRLVVVTCEDYDPATGDYASNVVVTARRTR